MDRWARESKCGLCVPFSTGFAAVIDPVSQLAALVGICPEKCHGGTVLLFSVGGFLLPSISLSFPEVPVACFYHRT